MRLFRVESDKKFIEYKVQDFKDEHREEDLEYLLESNPDAILDEEIMIIGRQVKTNFNTFLDLLGLDRTGNSAVIELKRDKTPRDTIAQALEYASYIEQLDYGKLERIYQDYTDNNEDSLADQHSTFFDLEEGDAVIYNKEQHIIVVGSDISREIRQQALYLNRKGIPTTCVEFYYFKTASGETLLSTDVTISGDASTREISTKSRTKTTRSVFLESLDENGRIFFDQLLDRSTQQGLVIHWGTVGFSINVDFEGTRVGICQGYPPKLKARKKSSVYGIFTAIENKLADADKLVEDFKKRFQETGFFVSSGKNMRWTIDSKPSMESIHSIVEVFIDLAEQLKHYQIRE